jgi:hypothetical protein
MSLYDAAVMGDRLHTLRQLRDLLALRIQDSDDDRSLAALSRQLTLVMAEIESLGRGTDERTPLADVLSLVPPSTRKPRRRQA